MELLSGGSIEKMAKRGRGGLFFPLFRTNSDESVTKIVSSNRNAIMKVEQALKGLADIPPNHLNIMGYVHRSEVNGPGRRAIVWVQGCLRKCPGCF